MLHAGAAASHPDNEHEPSALLLLLLEELGDGSLLGVCCRHHSLTVVGSVSNSHQPSPMLLARSITWASVAPGATHTTEKGIADVGKPSQPKESTRGESVKPELQPW